MLGSSSHLRLQRQDATVTLLESLVHLQLLFVARLDRVLELEFARLRAQVLQLLPQTSVLVEQHVM